MAFPIDLRHLPVIGASLAHQAREGLSAREASSGVQDIAAQSLAAWRNILLGLSQEEWGALSAQESFWQNSLKWLPYLDHDSSKPRQGWWGEPFPAPLAMEASLWQDLGVNLPGPGLSEIPLLALLHRCNPFEVSASLGQQMLMGAVEKGAVHAFEALLRLPGAPLLDEVLRWPYSYDKKPLLFTLISQNYHPQFHRTILDVVLEQHSTNGVVDNEGLPATFHGSAALLEKLLVAGADVDARSPQGLLLESHWAENSSAESALPHHYVARKFRSPEQDVLVRDEFGMAMLRHGDFDLARKEGLVLPNGRVGRYEVGGQSLWPLAAVSDALLNLKAQSRDSQRATSVLGLLAPAHLSKVGMLESIEGIPDVAHAAVALLSCKSEVYEERKKKIADSLGRAFTRLAEPSSGWGLALAKSLAKVSNGWSVSEVLLHWHTDGKAFGVELSPQWLPELLPALKQQLNAVWKDKGLVQANNSASTGRQYRVAVALTSQASDSGVPPGALWEIALPWALFEICRRPSTDPRPMMDLAVEQFGLLARSEQASAFGEVVESLPAEAQKMLQSEGAALLSALKAAHLQGALGEKFSATRPRPRM